MKNFFFLFFLALLWGSDISAEAFTIETYDVQITIQDEGYILVKEDISVLFSEQRRGIFRNIPVEYNVDGKKVNLKITDIKVAGWPIKTTREGSQMIIRIGDADRYVSGRQTYSITYQVSSPFMSQENYDEFFWNIIGPEWDTPISKATFSVRFPFGWKEKISEFITFSGSQGNRTTKVPIIKEDNRFYFTEGISLAPMEGITAAFKIPKGLLPEKAIAANVQESSEPYIEDRTKDWLSLIPAGLAALLFGFWRKNGQRQKDPDEVTLVYEAPEGMSPAEVGTFYDYKVNRRDIISLLPYWGQKGYLRMKSIQDDVYFQKVREIDDSEPPYAITFFNALFENGDSILLSSLKESFYKSMSRASTDIMKDVKDQQLFDMGSMRLFHSGWMIGLFIIFLILGIVSFVALQSLFIGLGLIILGIFCLVLHFLKPKLSDKGYELHQYLRGFYHHLKNPDPEVLKEKMDKDPDYLHKVFPYALAFGLDKEWEEYFKNWEVPTPYWYMYDPMIYGAGYHPSYGQFTRDFGAHKIEKVFYSTPPPPAGTSSGGGFSGGGSVGGGFGGGGGGSW